MLFRLSCIVLVVGSCAGASDIKIASKELDALKKEPEIRVVYHPSMSVDISRHIVLRSDRYSTVSRTIHLPFAFEDPLEKVQSHFSTALMTKLDIGSLQTIRSEQPLSEYLLSLVDQLADRGVVFKFDTQYWQVVQRFQYYQPRLGTGVHYYNLRYAAEGRLVRDTESNLLWKALCTVDLSFEASSDIPLHELIADENSLIYLKRQEAAVSCGNQMLEKFFGK